MPHYIPVLYSHYTPSITFYSMISHSYWTGKMMVNANKHFPCLFESHSSHSPFYIPFITWYPRISMFWDFNVFLRLNMPGLVLWHRTSWWPPPMRPWGQKQWSTRSTKASEMARSWWKKPENLGFSRGCSMDFSCFYTEKCWIWPGKPWKTKALKGLLHNFYEVWLVNGLLCWIETICLSSQVWRFLVNSPYSPFN